MNTSREPNEEGRLSGRVRAAILLASLLLVTVGAVGLHRALAPVEPEPMADPAPTPTPRAPAPPRPRTIAAVPPKPASLVLPPVRETAPRDRASANAVRDQPLKDAVGDFRLLTPGGDKVPNTTIGKPKPKGYRSWRGPYAGINLGGASGMSTMLTSIGSQPDYFLAPDISQLNGLGSVDSSAGGFVGGAQVGYDCQHESVVMGLEADFDALQVSRKETQTGNYNSSPANTFALSQSFRTDWLFTVRPRVGLALDRLLLYGTGGLAVTRFKYDAEFTDTFSPALARQSLAETRLGWTAGAGAEYRLREHWSLKAEYLYADFGKVSTTSMLTQPAGKKDFFNHSATFDVHIVRLGLNYRF